MQDEACQSLAALAGLPTRLSKLQLVQATPKRSVGEQPHDARCCPRDEQHSRPRAYHERQDVRAGKRHEPDAYELECRAPAATPVPQPCAGEATNSQDDPTERARPGRGRHRVSADQRRSGERGSREATTGKLRLHGLIVTTFDSSQGGVSPRTRSPASTSRPAASLSRL